MKQTTNNKTSNDIIDPDWILLDICSIISSIRNRDLVQDICAYDAGKELRSYNNGRHQYYNYTATISIITFKVFYNKKSLANIISFDLVARKFSITIDTDV